MKKSILALSIFSLTVLSSMVSYAVNDNYTENNTYSPTGGSLSNNLSANGNSASNNGSISSSSSAFANKLDSSITGVQRFDTSNNQLGNSSSTSSLGNISNNSAGGAGGYSGGNTLGNSQGQGQSSSNTNGNTSAGNSTSINSTSTTTVERTAPPLINTQVVPMNNNGYNLGVTTLMGGFQGGISKVDKSAKAVNFSQSAFIDEQKTEQLIKNTERACALVSSDECSKLKTQMLRKMNVHTTKGK
jgi:hypothetical protein